MTVGGKFAPVQGCHCCADRSENLQNAAWDHTPYLRRPNAHQSSRTIFGDADGAAITRHKRLATRSQAAEAHHADRLRLV